MRISDWSSDVCSADLDRVPAFVIVDAFAIGIAQDDRPFRPEHDLLQSIDKIAVVDLVLLPARSEQGRLIDQVLDVRAGYARGGLRDLGKVDIVGKRHLSRMNLQDCFAAVLVGQVDHNPAIEAARPEQGLVQNRSEEHTSELQALMRNSYAVFCLTKKIT